MNLKNSSKLRVKGFLKKQIWSNKFLVKFSLTYLYKTYTIYFSKVVVLKNVVGNWPKIISTFSNILLNISVYTTYTCGT